MGAAIGNTNAKGPHKPFHKGKGHHTGTHGRTRTGHKGKGVHHSSAHGAHGHHDAHRRKH